MNNPNRDTILEKLRAIPSFPAPKREPREPIRPESGTLLDSLAAKIGTFPTTGLDIVETPEQARAAAAAYLSASPAKTALLWDHPLLQELGLPDLLRESGMEILPSAPCTEAARADLGVTSLDALIADSGTLVAKASQKQPRSVSLLPPSHLAIGTTRDIHPDILHFMPSLQSWKDKNNLLPSATQFITGSSSTADIELVIVHGVHGPKALHLILLKE